MKTSTTLSRLYKEKRTLVMGILNVTPDSFFDGGLYVSPAPAFRHACAMIKDGADIIDIGGESTRPGSLPVDADEELRRVIPVIKKIRQKFGTKIVISIDTNKAEVAKEALVAGADMVNSLGGFTFDPLLAKVVAHARCPVVIYHIKGIPRSMQKGKIVYTNVINEINQFFKNQIMLGEKYGIKKNQFILDPGIGFGKDIEHNLAIVKGFRKFGIWKLPTLIGVSRKSHLGKLLQEKLDLPATPGPEERIEASLAEAGVAVLAGARIVRTHDVRSTKRFLVVLNALK